jgi:hypothetical protein
MRTTLRGQEFNLQDSPGCFRLFGLFFLAVSGMGLAVSLGLDTLRPARG